MNAKSIALIITFVAIAIVLNVVKIPFIFYPGALFELSPIPIVVAFLLFGARTGVLVAILNLSGAFVLFPIWNAIIFYPMDFLSQLLMFAGLYAAGKLMTSNSQAQPRKKLIIGSTALATAIRGGIMPLIDYGVIYHVLVPLVFSITFPESFIVGLVPAFVLYNVITPLYTIPVAYVITARAKKLFQL